MASKLQVYRQMSEQAQRQLTGSLERWQSFLTTAARLYKYPYHEQVMIHAQRPEATACAEYDVWNDTMHRYVRRGSKGIALIDTSGDRDRLRYVFDVADTGTRPNSRNLNLWQLREEHMESVSAMLERNYGIPSGANLREQFEAVATQLAREYWDDNKRDILDILEDSFLEEYDEFNVGVAFRNAAEVSITYSLLSRCGLNPNDYFEHEDFMSVFDFNTPETAGALGTAVSGINQQVLREIGVAIRNYEREQYAERSAEYGNDVQTERGLSDPEHQTERTGGEAHREVWTASETVSERTPSDPVEQADPVGAAVSPSSGDRRDGTPEAGRDDAPAGEAGRSDRGTESQRPDDVGRADEQSESTGGGDHPDGAGVQLTDEPAPAVDPKKPAEPEKPVQLNTEAETVQFQQMTLDMLFPTEQEQISRIDEADRTQPVQSAFSFAQTDIDHILRIGSNSAHTREHIVDAFQKQKSIEEIAVLLQKKFHGGYGIKGERGDYAAWYAEDGIHLHRGRDARFRSDAQIIAWTDAAERIGQLLEDGSFATNVELAEAEGFVRSELALHLLYLRGDLSDEAREQGYLSCLKDLPFGYPEATAALAERMTATEFQETLKGELAQFIGAYLGDRGLLRFHYHKMDELWQGVKDLSLERREYASDIPEIPDIQGFITEDEINAELARGSNVSSGKGRIYAFFTAGHTTKEKANFLKSEYGIGGHSHALSGSDHAWEDHSSKGIKLRKDGCADVELNWTKVAERITGMIQKDRYFTPEQMEAYERMHLEDAEPEETEGTKETKEASVGAESSEITEPAPEKEQPIAETSSEIPNTDGSEAVISSEPRPVTAEEINDALIRWNGSFESKVKVNDYMLAHGRERGTAQWLKDAFGGGDTFPVQTDHGNLELPWARVQRQLGMLVTGGNFLTEVDRMLAQAEVLAAQEAVPSYERFTVIETEDGYGIWDDLHDGLYVDEDGVTTDFDSERVAEDYLKELRQKISDREAAEWLYVERSKMEVSNAQTAENEAPIDTSTPGDGSLPEQEHISQVQNNDDLLGVELTIEGRRFVVDEIQGEQASLRDITFQANAGFPVFRNMHVDEVRGWLNPTFVTDANVNMEAELTEAELKYLRPQLDAAGIDYLVANAGYNARTISFSSEDHQKVQAMLDAIPDDLEQRTQVEAVYPGDKTGLPYDIVLETIRTEPEPEPPVSTLADEVASYEAERQSYREQVLADLTPEQRTIVDAWEAAGFPFNPSKEHPTRMIFGGEESYPMVFNSWQSAYDAIDSAELKDTPGLRDKVQMILHPELPAQEDALDANPISVQIGGEWQTFPNRGAAEDAMYADFKEQTHRNAQNFHITDEALGVGGPKAKYQANISAIRLLKYLEENGLQASPEQQEVLSRYVGWGGLADAFDPNKASWGSEYVELKKLLTPEEYEAARASTLNAHYTSPTVIHAMYEALGRMGFENGNILEPSMGIGNFFGCLPEKMQNSRLYGVELDSITGRIAKQLYPKANITVAGFETTDRRDFYDVAIGNVPFGQYQVNDRAYNKLGFSIHDYFFAKSLDQVRPGGVVAFVTSRYTMDKQSPEVRKYIAQRAELLGAIRLPNNAFRANAGTDVVSDIIFLQRRDRPITIEPDWVHLEQNEDGFAINSYFVQHPEMILGRQSSESTQYGRQDFTVEPIEGLELADQLHDAVKYIRGSYQAAEFPDLAEEEQITDTIPADPDVRNYSYTVVDGEVYYRQNSLMSKPELNAMATERVKGLVGLRDCLRRLIDQQMDAYEPDSAIQRTQAELNQLYDTFSAKYGLINSRANALAFQDDSSYYLLCTLEELDEEKQLKRKADIFTKRTIKPHEVVTSVDTPSEALALSISEKACVDLDYMAQLTGMEQEELLAGLRGVIFQDPIHGEWQTADEYLSGNVRQKLRIAERAAESNPAYLPNVEALRASQPKDLDASEIEVRLGATWIDQHYIQQFMEETFEPPYYLRRNIQVHYSSFSAEWNISGKSSPAYNDVNAYMTYGTDRANAYRILEDTLNLRDIRIYDTKTDPDGKERRVLNSKETTLAQQKQQAIKDAFQEWVWRDPDRRQELVQRYNELFNSTRPREYDGRHISFSGMNPEIHLREHQLNAVAHILYGGNTLLAHEVGAGKTFEMVAAAMESKRLGLCHKPMFVVPNHLTEQWASEFLRLYPSANILAATKKDFEPKNRKKFCARIATGDYDAIIIGHSQFERIPVSMERQEALLRDQIDEITEGIEELKASRAEKFTIKAMERTKKGLEVRLKKLMESGRKDDVVTFEELGVDRLYVDEAHAFKNLFLYTKMRNVAGLSTSDAQKSSDMLLKCRYIDELTGSKGVVFATGTPVSNSMTELYTMMRYLQHDTLQQKGLAHFDCWASTFGETTTAIELAPEGTGYRARTRFAKFFNLPELMTLFKEVADIKTSDQLHLPTPEAVYHNVVAQPTEIQQAMVQELSERAARVHAGAVDASVDNMLRITTDGRKLGLDQRIINPNLPDDPASKVNLCVDNIYRIWDEGQADKLTQLVFCDLSTPKTGAPPAKAAKAIAGNIDSPELHAVETAIEDLPEEPEFTVYDDIREKLVSMGIPREQIAFIHEANTEARKKDLFAKVRSGQVRVLMGSTFKMGAGMNVQDRLVALHDLDAPWRPGDLEQRSGRIIRQGNQNKEVHIFRYVTEATFDAYLWQTLENKQKFISQIMTSKSPVRSCDDIDETALSFAEIKALCAGDDRIREKMDLDVDVARLKLMRANHQSQQYRLEDNILRHFPEQIEQNRGFIAGFQADMQTLSEYPHPQDGFVGMIVRGDVLTDKENAGAALVDAMKEVKGLEPVQIGSYRGFQMSLTLEDFGKQYVLTLKGKMSHRVELGKDPRGNLIRIDNALAAMEGRMTRVQEKLDSLYIQMENAKAELGKPFPQEQELREKAAQLAELNIALNIDDRSPLEAMMDVSAEEPPQTAITAKSARPSVLDKLHAPLPPRVASAKQNEKEVR